MSEAVVSQLLETAFKTNASDVAIAWENVTYVPVDGTPYQQVNIMFAKTQNPVLTTGFKRLIGYMQVMLQYPQGFGGGPARLRAETLVGIFKRGASFKQGQTTVVISPSPYLNPGRVDGNRWALPLIIPFFANVFE